MSLQGFVNPSKENAMAFQLFALCDKFGWTLDELGVPQKEQKEVIQKFIQIIVYQRQEEKKSMKEANRKR